VSVIGWGSETETLTEESVRALLREAFAAHPLEGKRLLVIIPDLTRSAPIPLLFRLLYEVLGDRVAQLDYLIALGTHQPLSEGAIARLVGVSGAERAVHYPKSVIYNHSWDDPGALKTVGVISSAEMFELTDGLVNRETPINLNHTIHDYDELLILGPVFPHEVAGFSGGAKYLFPGIAGREIIDSTHWLGALATSYDTIGVKDTAVRRVLHRGARFVTEHKPVVCLKLVMKGGALHGLFIGDYVRAWVAAADLSAKLNIVYKPKPFKSVLSMPSEKYDDLWTAAKAMYKTEPVIEDGGEVIIYAPHITQISVTHGPLIEAVGYHVRDYFLGQWESFKDVAWTVLAHSTHVKGAGSYEGGLEQPRIQVTLATSIPREICERVNLGYRDFRDLNPNDWANREAEGLLLVKNAGEVLYRLEGSI
jgi:nickel-dependent lactate racemase